VQPAGTRWDPGRYHRFTDHRLRPALDLLARVPVAGPSFVCDLGCGSGNVTRVIAERFPDARVVGIDTSSEMLAKAAETPGRVEWIRADVAQWEPERAPDLIYSNAALHWMKEDPPGVIACVARALRPGGRFVAEMGAYRNVRIITDALYRALAEEGVPAEAIDFPWYFPRTSRYVGLLEDGGFDVTQLHYFARPTPLDDCPNGLADWIDMFGRNFTDAAPSGRVPAVIDRAVALTRDRLCPDGRWVTDYTRLRFVAVRVSEG
jgi:trans-aconitate methyltransferase